MAGNSPLGPLAAPQASQGNTYAPSAGNNIGGFLQSLLGGLQQGNDARSERQLKKTQMDEIQRQSAQSQLDRLTAIAKSDPSKQEDTAFQAQVKKLAAVAMPGINPITKTTTKDNPDAGTTGPDTPGEKVPSLNGGPDLQMPDTPGMPALNKQVTLPRETLDMNVLAPQQDINRLTDAQKNVILATPKGPLRDKLLEGYSGVDKSWHDAPTLLSQQDRNQVHLDVRDFVNNVGSGKLSGAGASAALSTIRENAIGAGMSIDGLIAEVTDPSVLGPAIANKMAEATAAGLDKEALTAYHKMLAIDTPAKWKAQLLQGDTRNAIAQQRANTADANEKSLAYYRQQQSATNAVNAKANADKATAAISQADTAIAKNDQNALKANITSMTSVLGSLNKQATDQKGIIDAMLAATQDPSDGGDNSPMKVLSNINAQIKTLQGKIAEAGAKVSGAPSNHVQTSSGNQTAAVNGVVKPPSGPPAIPSGPKGPLWLNDKKDGYVDAKGNPVR